jgi:hypothetical protein
VVTVAKKAEAEASGRAAALVLGVATSRKNVAGLGTLTLVLADRLAASSEMSCALSNLSLPGSRLSYPSALPSVKLGLLDFVQHFAVVGSTKWPS